MGKLWSDYRRKWPQEGRGEKVEGMEAGLARCQQLRISMGIMLPVPRYFVADPVTLISHPFDLSSSDPAARSQRSWWTRPRGIPAGNQEFGRRNAGRRSAGVRCVGIDD